MCKRCDIWIFDQYEPISSSKDLLARLKVLTALFVTLLLYLCFGAACFSALETEYEDERWSAGKQDVMNYANSQGLSNASTVQLIKLIRQLADEGNPFIYEHRTNAWSFAGGLYVGVSTVTTIGYGNIYPMTLGGQIFLVAFALIGIPLSFLFIAYLGALLASSVEWILLRFRERNSQYNCVMFLVLMFSACIVILELLLFAVWIKYGLDKEMSYWEAFYFAFISFTTIGFGNHQFYNGDNANVTKVLFTLLCVILCLAPLSLYINLLVRDVMNVASPILEKIGVGGIADNEDEEKEMISRTKEFKGETYGAAEADPVEEAS